MAAFCHECGAPRAADSVFCEQCGTSLRPQGVLLAELEPPRTPHAPRPSPGPIATPRRPVQLNQRLLIGGAVGVLALVLAGGGAWWWLTPGPATEAKLLEGAKPWLTGDGLKQVTRPCLHNFDYQASPVSINPDNQPTREWLDGLVKAGLYQGPETVSTGNSWQPLQLRYEKTAKAATAIEGNRLCAASRLEVLGLEFNPKAEEHWGPMRIQRGTLKLRWEDRAAWSDSAPFKSQFDGEFSEQQRNLLWVAQDKGWRLMTSQEESAWQSALRHPPAEADQGLSSLFSGGDSPEKVAESMLRAMMDRDLDTMAKLAYSRELSPEAIRQRLEQAPARPKNAEVLDYVLVTRVAGDQSRAEMELTARMKTGETQFLTLELRSINHQWRVVMGF
jgi:hypothetical protein